MREPSYFTLETFSQLLLEDVQQHICSMLAARLDPLATLRAAGNGAGAHCYVKGCVMPTLPHSDECAYHRLVRMQPEYFESQQPSLLLLAEGKYGVVEQDPDEYIRCFGARLRDRRRLALERDRFLEEAK